MKIRFLIKFIFCLLTIKFAFADIMDVKNEQIIELLNANIPIIDVRTSSEWKKTGIIPNSILLTFFDNEGNYNFDEWSDKLFLELNKDEPIILICRSGKRSRVIAEIMDNNFDKVIYNAKNGITSWIGENLITVKPEINK